MNIVKRKLSDLNPCENNVRRHNNRQIDEMVKSIDSFGVIRPIIIDEGNNILCGNGLYNALLRKGDETADCMVVKNLSASQKKKLMIADNKIYELATSNYDEIERMLKELADSGDFEIPGYDAEVLEEMYGVKSIENDAEVAKATIYDPTDNGPEAEEDDEPYDYGDGSVSPSKSMMEERAKAQQRRVIVCPVCGAEIEI